MMASVAFVLPLSAAAAFAFRGAASTSGRLLLALVAGGVFVGVLSVPWSMLIFGNVHTAAALMAVDAMSALAIAAIGLRGPRSAEPPRQAEAASQPAIVASAVLLAAAALVALVGFVSSSAVQAHGEWDAWAQWNLHARFFFRGLTDGSWRVAFDPILAWSHADYPPLLPATVARLWTYAGRESVVAPITIAALFAGSTVLAAGVSVWRRRGAVRGCLAATAILATPSFMHWAPSQCADIPLAFFMLAAFILWQEEHGVLAGLAAGLAAWTKNEGVAFLVVFVIIVVCAELSRGRRQALRRIGPVAAGAAGVALAVITFKLVLAPPSYFTVGQTFSQTLMRTLDLRRAEFIAHALGRELWTNGASMIGVLPILSGFALVRGISRQAPAASAWGGIAVAAMIVVYFLAYLATPLDVAWQVQTSVQRLVVQLVPLAAWSVLSFAA